MAGLLQGAEDLLLALRRNLEQKLFTWIHFEIPVRFPMPNAANTDLIYYMQGSDLMAARLDEKSRRLDKAFKVPLPQGSNNLLTGSTGTIGDPGMVFVRPVVRSGVWPTKLPD